MDLSELEQRTPAWYAARLGHATGSGMKAILTKGRGSAVSATREGYKIQIVAERLTGLPDLDHYESAAMRRGNEQEPFARSRYESHENVLVEEVGFVLHPTIAWAGCSPDGLVGTDGQVQIKCPSSRNHLETV